MSDGIGRNAEQDVRNILMDGSDGSLVEPGELRRATFLFVTCTIDTIQVSSPDTVPPDGSELEMMFYNQDAGAQQLLVGFGAEYSTVPVWGLIPLNQARAIRFRYNSALRTWIEVSRSVTIGADDVMVVPQPPT